MTAENAGTSAAGWSRRARTARPRSRATRSSRSAASPSFPTCSRTQAASPSRTSSGCRTSAASSGTATRSAGGSPRSSATPSIACGPVRGRRAVAAGRGARGGDPRGRGGARSPRDVPVTAASGDLRARDAMVTDRSRSRSRRRAGSGRGAAQPEVRAVLRLRRRPARRGDDPQTLVREVVAAGRDPRRRGSATSPSRRCHDRPRLLLADAFHLLEEHDLERVPVVDNGTLVGVLSGPSSSGGSPRTTRPRSRTPPPASAPLPRRAVRDRDPRRRVADGDPLGDLPASGIDRGDRSVAPGHPHRPGARSERDRPAADADRRTS